MRPQPLIAVSDVEASSLWYQRILGCQSAHGGPEYERLVAKEHRVVGENLKTLYAAFEDGSAGAALPEFVRRELAR
jgi:hypothetical protein